MIGMVYLIVGLLYLLLSAWLVKLAVKKARARGVAGWKWGAPVGLVMYLLVFWDWIPTVVMHQYYCATEAGFTVYKTLDEWRLENPGVEETLQPSEVVDSMIDENRERYDINQRFAWLITSENVPLRIRKRDSVVIDKETSKVLARYIDFVTDVRAIGLGPRNMSDYKFWLKINSCESSGKKNNQIRFFEFEGAVEKLGGNTK